MLNVVPSIVTFISRRAIHYAAVYAHYFLGIRPMTFFTTQKPRNKPATPISTGERLVKVVCEAVPIEAMRVLDDPRISIQELRINQ